MSVLVRIVSIGSMSVLVVRQYWSEQSVLVVVIGQNRIRIVCRYWSWRGDAVTCYRQCLGSW